VAPPIALGDGGRTIKDNLAKPLQFPPVPIVEQFISVGLIGNAHVGIPWDFTAGREGEAGEAPAEPDPP
jgi:hypothetical protein